MPHTKIQTRYRNRFWFLVIAIFLLLEGTVLFSWLYSYSNSKENVKSVGEVQLAYESARIENYMQKCMDVIWILSDSVHNMLEEGRSLDEVLAFLTAETNLWLTEIDKDYTGIYGYFKGRYLDGLGWEPPPDYKPQGRDWYIAAIKGGGKPVLVSPYVDAQTNTIMISVSRLLPDGASVISMDIKPDGIQELIRSIHSQDSAVSSFVVDGEGQVVAHHDSAEIGKNYLKGNPEQAKIVSRVFTIKKGNFSTTANGKKCSVFTSPIMDRWQSVVVVDDTQLFRGMRARLLVFLIVYTAIFVIIASLCYIAYKKLMRHSRLEADAKRALSRLNDDMIFALAHTVDAKDRYTSGHSRRVAQYAKEIARRMGKSEEEQRLIFTAGLLHDLGKIRVPEELINKAEKLTDAEYELITIHTVSGYQILKDIYKDKMVAYAAKYHHERFDGKGYPNGLSGTNIPEVARIIGVADSYDAMASNRSYRKALPQHIVREQILTGRGSQFDPVMADIMLQMIDEDSGYTMRQEDVRKYTILVFDDELINIKLVTRILQNEATYTVIGVQNYTDAEKILSEQRVDLVLLDFLMPNMNGLEAIRRIRQRGKNVPVIFMTADRNLETITRAMEAGATDYVTKPLVPISLKEIIRCVLANDRR